MPSARGGEKRSDGQPEMTWRNSFADSGVNSDTRPITGHDLRKETLSKLQSRESRRGSVFRLPIMGTSFESKSRYGCPDRVVLIQRAYYLPIHGMSDQRHSVITLNCLFATSVIFSCIQGATWSWWKRWPTISPRVDRGTICQAFHSWLERFTPSLSNKGKESSLIIEILLDLSC